MKLYIQIKVVVEFDYVSLVTQTWHLSSDGKMLPEEFVPTSGGGNEVLH